MAVAEIWMGVHWSKCKVLIVGVVLPRDEEQKRKTQARVESVAVAVVAAGMGVVDC